MASTAAAYVTVALSGLVLFVLAEANSWRIPIWKTMHCRQFHQHMAYFPIPAEVTLALTTYFATNQLLDSPFLAKAVAALVLMVIYVGTAALSYLYTDAIPKGITCNAK